MLIIRIFVILGIVFSSFPSLGQSNNRVNTSGVEAYFKLATALGAGNDVNEQDWQEMFQTPVYQMMISFGAIDTAILKYEMKQIFASKVTPDPSTLTSKEQYHKAYKDNFEQLENYISLLNTANVVDSVKFYLYPFLPDRLQSPSLFPELFYLNYGAPEATGIGGLVLNDLLHSYRIDNYKFGLLTAHEAFHAIVSVAFQQAMKQNIDYNAPDFNLLYFLQNVSEEGVADLIDKPLLQKKESPLFMEVKQLTENDEALSFQYIRSLDSLLSLAFTSENVLINFESFSAFANKYGRNGGHIPGRFMGAVINESGLLQKHLLEVENPISFFVTYNEAAKKREKKYPVFSKESLNFLQKLKAKYWQETDME